jgi:putative endonuclease
MIMFYVYAIKSQINSRTYFGQTQEINKRLQMHNSGHVRSTAKDRPWELLAIERFNTRKEARWIERQLKRSKGKREAWIHSHTI